MHVLNNEAQQLYRDAIENAKSKYQLVPPHNYQRNIAKRSIRTYKEHFIRILIGIDTKFPMSMWDHLIPQANITVNLLRQSNVHPHLSAWCHYNGLFDYNATPMGPAGCRVLIYEPVNVRASWGAHAIDECYTGPAMHHYRSFTVFASKTRSIKISDTVQFRHATITVPKITPEDKVIQAMSQLKTELAAIPTPNQHNQLEAMSHLRTLFSKCSKPMKNNNENTRKSKYENEENKEISNDSPRVPSTEIAPSPRVNLLDKPPSTIEKSTTKCKSPLNKSNSLLTH